MEEKVRTTTTQGLYYGLITGAGLIILSLILFIAGLYMNKMVSSISYLVLIAGMVYGTLDFRKTYSHGFLTYGKAFSLCFKIGLFASIAAAIYGFIFAQFIHPGFVQEILDQSRESILKSNPEISEEQMEMALEWTARFTTPVMIMVWGFIMNTIASAVIGLLAALFLKKEDPSLKAAL